MTLECPSCFRKVKKNIYHCPYCGVWFDKVKKPIDFGYDEKNYQSISDNGYRDYLFDDVYDKANRYINLFTHKLRAL